MFALREYQKTAVENVISSYKSNEQKQLIVVPTGGGKTVIAAALTKELGKKVLFIAHRHELLKQAYKTFTKYMPKASIGYCWADKNELDKQIIVASIQSCSNRLEQLKAANIQLVIIDEAHHAGAKTYQKLINELVSDDVLLLGITATPIRNNASIDHVFPHTAYTIEIADLIQQGYLSKIIGRRIRTRISLKGVSTAMGDYAIGELSQRVNIPERNALIFNKWTKYSHDRKTLIFACDIQHAYDLCSNFSHSGISAAVVH